MKSIRRGIYLRIRLVRDSKAISIMIKITQTKRSFQSRVREICLFSKSVCNPLRRRGILCLQKAMATYAIHQCLCYLHFHRFCKRLTIAVLSRGVRICMKLQVMLPFPTFQPTVEWASNKLQLQWASKTFTTNKLQINPLLTEQIQSKDYLRIKRMNLVCRGNKNSLSMFLRINPFLSFQKSFSPKT